MADNDNDSQERRVYNGEILKTVREIHTSIKTMAEDVATVKAKMSSVEGMACKHENILYGDPNEATVSGLINQVRENQNQIKETKNLIKYMQSTFLVIWAVITFGVNVAISLFKKAN